MSLPGEQLKADLRRPPEADAGGTAWLRRLRRPEARDLRWVPLGFLLLVLLGTGLLLLPMAHQPDRGVSFVDALFIATSAVCVTGLTPVDVAGTFTRFGQLVILVLVQAGGIGISMAATFFVLVRGERLSLHAERSIEASLGRLREARPVDIFAYSLAAILLCELAGVLALFHLLNAADPSQPPLETLWAATFHAISAFCNAGFSIWPDGLTRWRDHAGVLAVVDLLVVTGGIGLLALVNLRYFYFWRRDPRRRGVLSLQTQLSLVSAGVLIVAGTGTVLLFEMNHTQSGMPWGERLSTAVFHSVNCRTAGFNAVDLGSMHAGTLMTSMLLMFIGGAPGSMAGGIKTVTFALLVLTAWAAVHRREEIHWLHRRIPDRLAWVAVMITLVSGAAVVCGVLALVSLEEQGVASRTPHGWLALAFEVVSAFCTTGLSTGVTSLLSAPGKLVIVLMMFAGRVGPLMLTLLLTQPPQPWRVRRPEESVCLG